MRRRGRARRVPSLALLVGHAPADARAVLVEDGLVDDRREEHAPVVVELAHPHPANFAQTTTIVMMMMQTSETRTLTVRRRTGSGPSACGASRRGRRVAADRAEHRPSSTLRPGCIPNSLARAPYARCDDGQQGHT